MNNTSDKLKEWPVFSLSQLRILSCIAFGGALGSCSRYLLAGFIHQCLGHAYWMVPAFPWGTLAVYVLGCFVIGALAGMFEWHLALPPMFRLILITGFLGGFTTFSSFSYEALALYQHGAVIKAIAYVLASVVLTLLAVVIGFFLTKVILRGAMPA